MAANVSLPPFLYYFSAEDLHRELMATRKNLEYRFRAFTGDVSPSFPGYTKKIKPPTN